MKGFIFSFLISVVVCLSFECCSGKRNAEEEAKLKADSIARADSIRAVQEAEAKLKHEQAIQEWNNFTSPDLNTFSLKGHVKEVVKKFRDGYTEYKVRFSEDGKITYFSDGDTDKWTFKRNSDGVLTRIYQSPGLYFEFTYDKEGRLTEFEETGNDDFKEELYWGKLFTKFNEANLPVSGLVSGIDGMCNCSWSYQEFDDYLNWTHRTEFRKWTETIGDEDERMKETRTITYYEMEK